MLLGARGGRVKWDVDDEFQDRRRKDSAMPMSRGVRGAALLLSVAMGSAMVGCGGGSDSGPVTDAGGTTPPPTTPPPGSTLPPPGLANVIFSRNVATQPGPPNNDLFLVKEDGTGLVTVAASTPRVDVYVGTIGAKIIYSACDAITQVCELFSVNQDGSVPVSLASGIKSAPVLIVGGRVVFERTVGSRPGQSDIFSILPDSTGLLSLAATTDSEHLIAGGVSDERVVYIRQVNGQSDLYSINVQGAGGSAPLGVTPEDEVYRGIIGTRVLFERTTNGQGDLFSVNSSGDDLREVATSSDDETVVGLASARVIYTRRAGGQDDLWSVNGDGTSSIQLTNTTESESLGGAVGGGIVFQRDSGTQSDLYFVPVVGGAATTLANTQASEEFEGLVNNRIIYSAREGSNNPGFYAIDSTGLGKAPLAAADDAQVFAGGIGTRAIFLRVSQTEIWTVNADGSDSKVVASNGNSKTVYAVTKSRILYGEQVGNQGDLFAVSPDGTGRVVLASTPFNEFFSGFF